MKVYIHSFNGDFIVEIPAPTEEELAMIDGPDVEGEINPMHVYVDRKLSDLNDALVLGYDYS